MKKYKIIATTDLQTDLNTWTKGLDYEAVETDTKFQITSNEAQIAYVISLKEEIMQNFTVAEEVQEFDLDEIMSDIQQSTSSAFWDGYDTEKILLSPALYEAFKQLYLRVSNGVHGDFDKIAIYPIEVVEGIDSFKVVLKELSDNEHTLNEIERRLLMM